MIGELDRDKAEERIRWFAKCFPNEVKNFLGLDPELWINILLYENGLESMGYKSVVNFPMIIASDFTKVWVAPKDRHASCTIPSEYRSFKALICQIGCYQPGTKISFLEDDLEIENVDKSKKIKVLSKNATLDNLEYEYIEVLSLLEDLKPTNHELLKFEMASGGSLHVTKNHPILDSSGSIREAHTFLDSDSLVLEDGTFDPIASIEKLMFYGKVHNIYPKSSHRLSNILIANGYLNGSARYQTEDTNLMNRRLFRSYMELK